LHNIFFSETIGVAFMGYGTARAERFAYTEHIIIAYPIRDLGS
jgi:hypothetical protein